jgi:hypothetical protein
VEQTLSTDALARETLGRRLAMLSRLLEGTLNGPQEVHGLVHENNIYIVKARAL